MGQEEENKKCKSEFRVSYKRVPCLWWTVRVSGEEYAAGVNAVFVRSRWDPGVRKSRKPNEGIRSGIAFHM
jgi:hypothetical protein